MFDIRWFNIAIEVWTMAFCLIGIACTILLARAHVRYRNLFIAAFSFEFIAAAGDAFAGIYRGVPSDFAWAATHIGNFATFLGSFLLLIVLTTYLCARLEEAGARSLRAWVATVAITAIAMCVLAALGVFYYIDVANVYHRTDLYWIGPAYVIAINLVNATLTLGYRKRLSTMMFACMLFYTTAPIVAAGLQIVVYGINFAIALGILGLVILFLELQTHSAQMLAERTEELARSRVELSESRIAVMVSQIQPHFLFNTLDSIYVLCDEDVERAKKAIDEFSQFLRMNLKSLDQMQPVPIETELEHVRVYLELEKLSMEDLLRYEVDQQAGGFKVPALSVQTLVENAVKHGVGKKAGGGTVRVRTREHRDSYLVSIVDDGVGFDTAGRSDESGHVGLANTEARVAAMCNGTLEISSTPGAGTTAVIRIPKEGI